MYIDTHSHLYGEEFAADREEVIQRAKEARVEKIILPDIDSQTRSQMLELCDIYPDLLFPLIGLHPTSVQAEYKTELRKLEAQLGARKYYGIGECGIDLYWDKTFRVSIGNRPGTQSTCHYTCPGIFRGNFYLFEKVSLSQRYISLFFGRHQPGRAGN